MSAECLNNCDSCPALRHAADAIKDEQEEYNETLMLCMGDEVEDKAEREYLLSQCFEDSPFEGKTEQEIAVELRKDYDLELEELNGNIEEIQKDMARYAANCDGAIKINVTLQDGRKIDVIVCGSREAGDTDGTEQAVVKRSIPSNDRK